MCSIDGNGYRIQYLLTLCAGIAACAVSCAELQECVPAACNIDTTFTAAQDPNQTNHQSRKQKTSTTTFTQKKNTYNHNYNEPKNVRYRFFPIKFLFFSTILEDKNINAEVKISSNIEDINKSTHIILPGQGAFESCIKGLRKINGMIETLERNVLISKKPFLGICVGMQLLADQGYENGNNRGLGWIKGSIRKLNVKNQKLPHMGWNNVKIRNRNFEIRRKEASEKFKEAGKEGKSDCFSEKNSLNHHGDHNSSLQM